MMPFSFFQRVSTTATIVQKCNLEEYHNAVAILGMLASFCINEESLRTTCMLYRVCILNKGSASTPSAASNINAVFVVNGLRPLSISFKAE